MLCTAVFQRGGFAGKEQPLNSLAWREPFYQHFLQQCSCYFVASPACKWGLDWFKTWAIAATSNRIQDLAGICSHEQRVNFRPKRLPDGTNISPYPLNTLLLLLPRSLTLSSPGYLKQPLSILMCRFGNLSWPKRPSHKVLVSQMVPEIQAQQTGLFLKHRTPSKKFAGDGHHGS